ncbi:MAG TPA: YfhO family protein [Pyrinomonadaceae bacterium]
MSADLEAKQPGLKSIWSDLTRPQGRSRHCLFVLLFFTLLFTIFFSPVLFSGSLLAPGGSRLGDGLLSHLAYYLSEKLSWDPLLSCGFPMIADSQAMSWYPPQMLLSLIPGTWNIFVVSAYVMAGCFTYGYVYTLTESRAASFTSGIAYSMCGFMFAHLGHTAMLHTAVWLPLIIWSLENLRRRFSRLWLAIGCAAVACCVFAGHLQIVLYTLIVSAAYAFVLGWSAPLGRRRFYLLSTLLLILGLGLASLQILPTAELAGFSTRTDFAFSDFVSYSLPYKHIPLLLFPAAFGGLPHYGTTPYFGEWNLTEMSGYVGLLPLLLAAIGFFVSRRKTVAIFWLSVSVLALILALGERTPLASLIYQIPVLNRFRVPARHFIEMAFGISVLAGLGARAVLQRKISKRLLLITLAAGALLMTTALLVLLSNKISQHALERGVAALDMRPWSNPAVATPLVIFLLAAGALFYWQRAPNSLLLRALLLAVLVIDLASFGWFFSWHDFAPGKEVLNPPAAAAKYRELLRDNRQRMLSVRGTLGTTDELPPNLSRVWGVPNATGYGPLLPSRMLYLLSILPDGSIASSWKNPEDQSLNLTSVRYIFLPRSSIQRDARGISWHEENMDIWLGVGCDHTPRDAVQFKLPKPFRATSVGIVSRLACAVSLKEGEEVARVSLVDVDGNVETQSMLAGRDSSEWSYDCPSIKPEMQHARATVFDTFPAEMKDVACVGHFYLAQLKLSAARPISSVEIRHAGGSNSITIEKVSLVDELNNRSEAISPLSIPGSQWRFVEEAGEALIYENSQAMPRAWLVPEVSSLKPEDVLSAIKTSRLPDGRQFDPSRIALVEEAPALSSQSPDPAGSAQITGISDRFMEVQTSSNTASFLVTSDLYYPGWQATIDGAPVQLFRADYALRGVQVPAGRHIVRFEFRPKTFYLGVTLSALSLLVLMALVVPSPFSRKFAKILNIELTPGRPPT